MNSYMTPKNQRAQKFGAKYAAQNGGVHIATLVSIITYIIIILHYIIILLITRSQQLFRHLPPIFRMDWMFQNSTNIWMQFILCLMIYMVHGILLKEQTIMLLYMLVPGIHNHLSLPMERKDILENHWFINCKYFYIYYFIML